jgi:hypothetical protein
MSSSISSSDTSPEWGRSLIACFGTLAIGGLLLSALLVLVDPYDSGRFGWLGISGVADKLDFTADASRARDPQFDSAIFGNSTGQLLEPAQLSPATGRHFVQLIAPGASPHGHLAVLDFFLRHHARVGALVFVIDDIWCTHGDALSPQDPFPFWLYGTSTLSYAGHLLNWRTLDRTFQRITIGLGTRQPRRPDGFWSYEEVWPPGERQPPTSPRRWTPFSGTVSNAFPFATMLGDRIRRLPSDVPVVLLVPPVFHTFLPSAGSQEAADRQACNASYKSIVAGRPHSNFLDYRIDNELTRDPRNFADLIHYRATIARKLNDGVIESIKLGEAAKIDF